MHSSFSPSESHSAIQAWNAHLEALRRVDRYLNTAPLAVADAVEVGPFTLFLNRETEQSYASYARPTRPLPADAVAAIQAARAEFVRRQRSCRWEFLLDLWPDLPSALVQAGFPTPDRHPLMLVTPAQFRLEQPRPGLEIRALGVDEDPRPLLEVAHAAFGMDNRALEQNEVENLRTMMRGGLRLFGAWEAGVAVGTGAHLPVGTTTEVVGVATAPAYQKRGIAGQVTSAVVADAFQAGCDCVFLTAGDAPARRLYDRLGFEEVGVGMSVMEDSADDEEIV